MNIKTKEMLFQAWLYRVMNEYGIHGMLFVGSLFVYGASAFILGFIVGWFK